MIFGGLAGGSMTAGQMIGEYVGYVVLGILTGILLEFVASCIVTGWVGVLFTAFKIALILNWILEIYDLYTSWELTGAPKYLQEIGVQLAAGITAYGIFKGGLHDRIQEFIKWADTINIGGENSVIPNAGGSQGSAQVGGAEGEAPAEEANGNGREYQAPEGGGGVTNSIEANCKTVEFGHGGRHMDGINLDALEQAIANDVSTREFSGYERFHLLFDGIDITYGAYDRGNGLIKVGTYFVT